MLVPRFGHMRLRYLLSREPAVSDVGPNGRPTVICQYSSQGSVPATWLDGEFAQSCAPECITTRTLSFGAGGLSAGPPATGPRSKPPEMLLVWPRVEDVRNSVAGWVSGERPVRAFYNPCAYRRHPRVYAGGSIPSPRSNVYVDAIRSRHHVWDGTVSGRENVMPHMKSFLRFSVNDK